MNKCPYCEYVTPESEPSAARAWQEIAHMQLDHPEIIAERLERIGVFDTSPRFAERYEEGQP